jgi:hypothetical protein
MKRDLRCRLVILSILVLSCSVAALGAPLSHDESIDIGPLLDRARTAYDLENEDAVVLLESHREDWTEDGRRAYTLDRIVFIRTRVGIGRYADLRVPYDGSRQKFTVDALRTWRLSDERWIVSGPTAQVDTLPHGLDRAPDFAHLRERMLLHDGVELPCVLEVSYTIEDLRSYRPGRDGLWNFATADPVLISRLVLGFPVGAPPVHVTFGSVPEPVRGRDDRNGLDTLTFELGPVEPRPQPWTPETIHRVPHVAWSTWKDWAALGQEVRGRFEDALVLDEELREALARALRKARSDAGRIEGVLDLVGESTRRVEYETGWWTGPRPAARTWSTAYGDRLDRAALAAALLREAGLHAELALSGPVPGSAGRAVPTLDWVTDVGLWVSADGVHGLIGPDSRKAPAGTAIWRPGAGGAPAGLWSAESETSRIDLRFDLSFDEVNEKWTGRGVMTATAALSPHSRMVGLDKQTGDYLSRLADSVFEGAEVADYNLARFEPAAVTVGFAVEVPVEGRDELNQLRLAAATPVQLGSWLELAAVRIQEDRRDSPVELPTPLEMRVELYLDTQGVEVIHLPEATRIENGAGCFESSHETVDEDELHVERRLVLSKSGYSPEEWPALRTLLLAEERQSHRIVVLE